MKTGAGSSRDVSRSPPGEHSPDLTGLCFSHYRVENSIGEGAMGQVWCAEDTRLERKVALKILPRDFAGDPERHARFEDEARILASLNHPNIATLHSLEHLHIPGGQDSTPGAGAPESADPLHVLVMELIEGTDLDKLIPSGGLPFDEAVEIALQICSGLQAAHARGIVHRDLKPANIKVRPDGRVKVLDFGLATTRSEAPSDTEDSLSPTRSRRKTLAGTVLGTYAYMSPEQARGKIVDRRSDIWAFGCILYELLSGEKAFDGDTSSDIIAAVLKEDPDWNKLPDGLNPLAEHVLRRCLVKDPSRRFHDIGDVRIELEEAGAGGLPPRKTRTRRLLLLWPALILLGLSLGFAAVMISPSPEAPLPSFRALTFMKGRVGSARFSPDGTTVVYGASTRDRALALKSTRTNSVASRLLGFPPAGVLGISDTGKIAMLLDRHSEGTWVSVGTLAVADLAGGATRAVVDRVNDGDISRDGARMAIARESGQTQLLEYPIGKVLFETRGWISHVRISPDAQRVAFLHHPYYGDDRGLVAMVDSEGHLSEITEDRPDSIQGLAWSPGGDSIWFSAFVFGKGGVLWNVRPGEKPVERLSSPISIRLQDIDNEGRMLMIAGDTRAEIAGLLADQEEERGFEGWNDDSIGGLSADGTKMAGNIQVATVDGEYAAYFRPADGSPPTILGYGDVFGMSPDGKWVFARKMTSDREKLFLMPTGAGQEKTIDLKGVRPDDSARGLITFNQAGGLAAFSGFLDGEGPRTYLLDLETEELKALGPVGTRGPMMSPDGAWVAASDPERRVRLYPVSGGASRLLEGAGVGEQALQWSLDGRSVFVWDLVFPARIHRVNIADGSRSLALEIMPKNPAGVLYGQILLSPGAEYYIYRYRRDHSSLFLVEGVLNS